MRVLDANLASPEENLACDEALLDVCEQRGAPEVLRFWEPAGAFVVVGYSNRTATEVDLAACQRQLVPVLRRVSGGGTVVQAPGCLNYALVLRIDRDPALASITGANQWILERHQQTLARLLATSVERSGDTDLALGNRKFSGNAQRRRKHALLFHGTFLLDMDLSLIPALLPTPSRQPAYRHDRPHLEFLVNLKLPADTVKTAITRAWNATAEPVLLPRDEIQQLVQTRYSDPGWSLRPASEPR